MITVENYSKRPFRDLIPYLTDACAQFARLEDRFPRDCTAHSIFNDFYTGRKALWLVLDDGRFIAAACSNIKTIDATGAKIATLCDLAGNGVEAYAAELNAALEQWADENGCEAYAVEGRIGWKPLLKQFGYEPHALLYRKKANGIV